jgi:hypothetical protein
MTILAVTVGDFASLPGFDLFLHWLNVSLHSTDPSEMESMSENDFECFASTGENTPGTMLPSVSSALPLHVTLFIPGAAAMIPDVSHQGFK